ncbi:cell division protein FtsI (penicillin-binding protein 3) [Quadrisphaera granulorum]|uniref:Cell division protein FtsI (Penicillin-binding protein 3) n=1 Tax=Quadrisphaera granulorum TaxID=317664 RepID=A0A315ZRG4_9ACTN|nr:cell division protein FtsI (penicillin-binding protein 3) [Quadrisphaera granulorum]SZE98720.1 cell division protein FtsI (penicillin-binding protein 3) [Quadrisphaera granulorum]
MQLQVTDAAPLAEQALGERLKKENVPAARGAITDRDGQVLAQDVERRDITADPKLFGGPTPREPKLYTAAAAAAKLAPVLGTSEAELTALLTPRTGSDGKQVRWTVLARGVTPAVRRQVQGLQIPGLSSDRKVLRTYPAGTTGGNLLGWVSTDGKALAGIELAQDDVLRGVDGRRAYERGKDGQRIPLAESIDVAPVNGRDVRLTLDADLQFYAQRAAAAQAAATRASWVAVVAMTKDGQVLALAESGSIDPAHPGATPEAERHNRSLEDVFEPGSTGKVITAAAAIEQGLATPVTPLVVPDRLQLPRGGGIVKDSHDHAPQKLTFAGVLAESSNVGTVMVGRKLTLQQRYDYLRAFGLGQKQLGLPGETRGILTTPKQWATNSRDENVVLFGQNYAVNALQAAQVYATIANGGVRVPPRVIAGTTDASGVYTPAPVPTGTRVVSPTTAAQVTSMLEGVVTSDGTGLNAAVPGFRVAGKTGTAEDLQAKVKTGTKQYTASFIGMAPAEDPQLVVAVIVQHPDYAHRFGGVAAAPVFSDVMGYALAQQGIAPSGRPAELAPLTWR